MKAKATKLAAICLAGALMTGFISSPVSAAKKVTIKGNKRVTMKVGAKKKFKANQKVKWTVKGKSIKIVKGKNTKTVTVQAKKKGTSTLTAKKGKKKASIKIQVTRKAADNTNTNTDVSASTTDMTKLTSDNFYKVTKVNGKEITIVSSDNKEYTTMMKSDIPVWREDEILTDTSTIQTGEYFKCTAYTYTEGNTKKTTYAALVISESEYQNIVRCRTEKNKDYYTMNVATFYIIREDGKSTISAAAYQNGPAVVKSIYADEDTAVVVNGVRQYNGCGKLTNGMRVLIQYGWEDENSAGNLINVNSIIAY